MRRNSRFVAITLVVLGIALHSAVAMAEPRTLSGTVTYRERIALPPGVVIEVKLVDVSLVDAPSKTIAEASVKPIGQVPVRYQLRFDDAEIALGRAYALQARITVDDRLWFVTTARHPVFAGGTDNTDTVVQRVSTNPEAPLATTPIGRWLAEDIRSGGVIDRLQSVLEIATDGTTSGSGGCNAMAGKATVSGDTIAFGPLTSTNKACPPRSPLSGTLAIASKVGTTSRWARRAATGFSPNRALRRTSFARSRVSASVRVAALPRPTSRLLLLLCICNTKRAAPDGSTNRHSPFSST